MPFQIFIRLSMHSKIMAVRLWNFQLQYPKLLSCLHKNHQHLDKFLCKLIFNECWLPEGVDISTIFGGPRGRRAQKGVLLVPLQVPWGSIGVLLGSFGVPLGFLGGSLKHLWGRFETRLGQDVQVRAVAE